MDAEGRNRSPDSQTPVSERQPRGQEGKTISRTIDSIWEYTIYGRTEDSHYVVILYVQMLEHVRLSKEELEHKEQAINSLR